jgi:hypothetical protein
MVDFGKAFNYWIDETHLAAEGARWAVVNKNPGSGDGLSLQQYVQQQGTTAELRDGGTASIAAPLQICIAFLTDSDDGTSGQVGDPVQVTATATYAWLPFIAGSLSILDTTITASATMRLEAVPSNYSAGCSGGGGP